MKFFLENVNFSDSTVRASLSFSSNSCFHVLGIVDRTPACEAQGRLVIKLVCVCDQTFVQSLEDVFFLVRVIVSVHVILERADVGQIT